MAVGLILGVDAEPTEAQFEELLEKGFIEPEGYTFEALSITPEDAADRDKLREFYKAACAKQGWTAGMALAGELEFADLMVQGARLVLVKPPPDHLESPAVPSRPGSGAVIAGIGFMPAQADLEKLVRQTGLPAGREYVIKSLSDVEAQHDEYPKAVYTITAKQQGWPGASLEEIAVVRRTVAGKRYLVVSPEDLGLAGSDPEPPKPSPVRKQASRPQKQPVRPARPAGPKGVLWWVGVGILPVAVVTLVVPIVGGPLLIAAVALMIVSNRRNQRSKPVPGRLLLFLGTFLVSFGVGFLLTVLASPLFYEDVDGGSSNWTRAGLVLGASVLLGLSLLWLWRRRQPVVRAPASVTSSSPSRPSSRAESVADVMAMRRREDVAGLTEALGHSDVAVRAEAAVSLGNLGNRGAVTPLIAVLEGDSDPYVRSLAAEALGTLGDPRARDALLASLQGDTMEVAAAATDALTRLK